MDGASLLGLILGIGGILIGNALEGGHFASLVQGAAAVIVVFGTVGATVLSSRMQDLKMGLHLFKQAFRKESRDQVTKLKNEIVEYVRIARKESILALEERLTRVTDPFLKDVLRAVVDGVDPQIVKETFETQVGFEEERLLAGAKVWTDAGGYAPTIGIIGAVLGLIHVMGNLTDTSQLGSGIAVAFVATIYGVGFANLVFLPIGSKIKKKIAEEMKIKEMILEGCLCIQSGITPSLTEIKLSAYVESIKRKK